MATMDFLPDGVERSDFERGANIYGGDDSEALTPESGKATVWARLTKPSNGVDSPMTIMPFTLGKNDYISGGGGDDTLWGAEGEDALYGGSGNDTYFFKRSDEGAYVSDSDSSGLILLSEDVPMPLFFRDSSSMDLRISWDGGWGWVVVRNYFSTNAAYEIHVASQRKSFSKEEVQNFTVTIGKDSAEVINGLDGGTNRIFAVGGNDVVRGGNMDDTIDGGAGDDSLEGGLGDDSYYIYFGEGNDRITEDGGHDRVYFKGVNAADVSSVTRSGTDLVLIFGGQTLTVRDYFSTSTIARKVEEFVFADGVVWRDAEIKSLSKILDFTAGNDLVKADAGDDLVAGGDGNDTLYGYAGADTLLGEAGNDTLYAGDGNDLLDGGDGNDYLSGDAGSDTLLGGAGNDRLYGEAGDDVLDGGAGDDLLSGGTGNDTYRFGLGSGQDTITSYDTAVGKLDVVQLGDGIAASDVKLTRVSTDLLLTIAGATDSLRISSYFTNDANDANGYYRVEEIRFADGTVWNVATVKTMVVQSTAGADTVYGYATDEVLSGGAGNDTLYGYAGADTLLGEAGNDTLNGGDGNDLLDGGDGNDYLSGDAGNDTLLGGAGNDRLYGEAGDDVLDGGAGDDLLSGGTGNDTYRFGLGSGQDTITSYDTAAGKQDVLLFGEGVSAEQLWLRKVGNNLEVSIIGSTDKVTVSSWYSNSNYRVEQIQTADGKVLLDSQVDALVSAMAAFTPPAAGQSSLPAEYQSALAPVIAASWQ